MSHLTIRTASIADTKTIVTLSRETFFDTFSQYNTKEDMQLFLQLHFSIPAIQHELAEESNTFLLAYDGDQVAGYVKLTEGEHPVTLGDLACIEIARLYATKPYIGKGVGKQLMQACIDLAQQKQKQVVWLGVWEHNHRAIGFYQQWGFEKFGEHDFILGHDIQNDFLMKKAIDLEH